MTERARDILERNVTLANGLKVHYYEWPGPRPNLVLLHPSSGYARMWEATANALGTRFHVYALDQRGHGDSGRPDGDYSAEEYAQDLHTGHPRRSRTRSDHYHETAGIIYLTTVENPA